MNNNIESKINESLNKGFEFKVGDLFNKAWNIFSGIAGYAILALVVYYIISSIINLLLGLIFPMTVLNYQDLIEGFESGDSEYITEILTEYSEASNPISSIISTLVSFALYPIFYSIYTMAYKFDNNMKVEFSDIFIHYKDGKFGKLFGTSIIIGIVSFLGVLLCVIPGIIIGIMWMLAIPLVIFSDASVGEALKYSRKLAFKSFGSFFLFFLALLGVLLIGLLLCCIGLIAAVPFVYVFVYVLYKEVVGFPNDKSEIEEIGSDIYKDNPYMN